VPGELAPIVGLIFATIERAIVPLLPCVSSNVILEFVQAAIPFATIGKIAIKRPWIVNVFSVP